jgi:hypothetical protein
MDGLDLRDDYSTMGIPIPQISPTGTLNFLPTQLAKLTPNLIPKGFVTNIDINSSFIFAKPKRKFMAGKEEISALTITTANSVSKIITKYYKSDLDFYISDNYYHYIPYE